MDVALEAVLGGAWALLTRASADRRHPARAVQLATRGADGAPRLRSVILRGADAAARRARFHTDRRSAKVAEIAADPRVALLLWDPRSRVQLRLAGIGENANYEYAIPRPNATPQTPKIRKRDRDRAEALRLAGGPKPSLRERAVALALERGVVRTRDLTEIGVPRCYLARMCDEGLLTKVSYGLYRATEQRNAA